MASASYTQYSVPTYASACVYASATGYAYLAIGATGYAYKSTVA